MPITTAQVSVTSSATLLFAATSKALVEVTPLGGSNALGDSGVTYLGGCDLTGMYRFDLHAGDEIYAAADTTGRVSVLAIT
jgi:hypothetical protein